MYTQFKQAQEQAAAEWLEQHKSELSDVTCHEQSYGERQGYEVCHDLLDQQQEQLDSILDEIVELEVNQESTWERVNGQDLWGWKAHQSVLMLSHWRKPQEYDDSHAPIGDRFDAEKYDKHQAKQIKKRKRFCIEYCYLNNGKVRAKLGDSESREQKAKAITIRNILDDLTF